MKTCKCSFDISLATFVIRFHTMNFVTFLPQHYDGLNYSAGSCEGDAFQCTLTRECIDTSSTCDGRFDCEDRSDEISCGKIIMNAMIIDPLLGSNMCFFEEEI